jgi:hypothetical protein
VEQPGRFLLSISYFHHTMLSSILLPFYVPPFDLDWILPSPHGSWPFQMLIHQRCCRRSIVEDILCGPSVFPPAPSYSPRGPSLRSTSPQGQNSNGRGDGDHHGEDNNPYHVASRKGITLGWFLIVSTNQLVTGDPWVRRGYFCEQGYQRHG